MKKIVLIILLIVSSYKVGKGLSDSLDFIVIDYKTDKFVVTSIDSSYHRISSNRLLDLHFYIHHFKIPIHLPNSLVNLKHKNDIVTVWGNEHFEKNFKTNWTHTFIYDSLSRIINYSYSNCLLCSRLPFDYTMKYDKNDRILSIVDNKLLTNSVEYRTKYDKNDNMIELNSYSENVLIQTIKIQTNLKNLLEWNLQK